MLNMFVVYSVVSHARTAMLAYASMKWWSFLGYRLFTTMAGNLCAVWKVCAFNCIIIRCFKCMDKTVRYC